MVPEPSERAPWWKYPVGLVAVLAPLAFIWKVDVGMAGGEYELNAWFFGYNGEYFRVHHSFPATFQTSDRVGAAAPLFYGYLLFKIGGLLSLIGGAHLAVRIVILACCAAVYLSVRHVLRTFRATEGLATAAACAVCWAVYPLTNLYNRCAFAEFCAASCLTCSCCLWAVFFLHPRRTTGWWTALGASFFLTLAAGTHPITGMLGVPFLASAYLLHWTVSVTERPSALRRHGVLLLSGTLACVVLSPWLYAYSKLGKELAIASTFRPGLGYFDDGNLTATLIRLAPIPMDYQQFNRDSPRLGVVHLDTQINIPLLIITFVLVAFVARPLSWGQRGRFACALAPLVALGSAAFVISVYRTGFEPTAHMKYPNFPSFLWKLQYAYRLVAVVNLSILMVLVGALAFYRAVPGPGPVGRTGLPPFALGVVAALSLTGCLVKLIHGKDSVAGHKLPLRTSDPMYQGWLVTHPFPASRDYVTPQGVPVLPDLVAAGGAPTQFAIGTGPEFGRAQPLHVTNEHPGYVGTQALPFKWSTFRVDGRAVPPEHLRLWHDLRSVPTPSSETLRVAVPVPAGAHVVEYNWAPPGTWSRLDAMSPWVLAGWFVGLVAAPVIVCAFRGRQTIPGAGETHNGAISVPLPPARAA